MKAKGMLCQLHRREVCSDEVGFLSWLGGCTEHSEESFPSHVQQRVLVRAAAPFEIVTEAELFTRRRVQLSRQLPAIKADSSEYFWDVVFT